MPGLDLHLAWRLDGLSLLMALLVTGVGSLICLVAGGTMGSPLQSMRTGIVAVPMEHDLTDLEITTLANLISLTPGTLTLDVSADRRVLFVHAMDASDPEEVRREVKQGFERRVRGLLR